MNKCAKIFNYVKVKLKEYKNPLIEDIVIFGSVLNGNCKRSSDLDLLVIFKDIDVHDFNNVKNFIFHYEGLAVKLEKDLGFLLGENPIYKKEFQLQIVGSHELRNFGESNRIVTTAILGSNTLNANEVNETLYHLSFRNFKKDKWHPRLPHGSEIKKSNNKYPEPHIERISFSSTIEGCFRAIYPNISHLMEGVDEPWLDLVLYKAEFKGDERIVTPNLLTEHELVWDAHVTKEYWVLDEVSVERVGEISFKNTSDKAMLTNPFNNPKNKPEVVGPLKIIYKLNNSSKSIPSLEWV